MKLLQSSKLPLPVLFTALFLCLGFAFWATNILLQEPSLGVSWEKNSHGKGLCISFIKQTVKITDIENGQCFVRIEGADGNFAKLTPESIIEDPDMHPSYAAYNAFFTQQSKTYTVLQYAPFMLTDTNLNQITLQAQQKELTAIPWSFWFQLFCGSLALLAGMAVLVFQPHSTVVRYYAINGFSFMLITFTAAIYSSRELALDGALIHALSALNHLGSLIFSASFMALCWYIPRRIYSGWFAAATVALYVLWWIADTLQWFENIEMGVFIPIVIAMLASLLLASVQWWRSRQYIEQRAALRWVILSLMIGGSLFVGLIIVAQILGITLIISQAYAFGFVLIIYLGISLSIIRYGLFDLERWWGTIWLWLLGGMLVIAFDALLIWGIGWQKDLSLAVSLLLAGWLYFPARQWVIRTWLKQATIDMQQLLPELVQRIILNPSMEQTETQWGQLLGQVFHALSVEVRQGLCKDIAIINQGIELHVPSLTDLQTSWCIRYAAQGNRLFSNKDVTLAAAITLLGTRMLEDKQNYQRSIEEERSRIAKDIHDDLGARLLSILQQSENESILTLAEEGIADMRIILDDLQGKPCLLSAALGEWRLEMNERCDQARISLQWLQPEKIEMHYLSVRQFNNLKRVLREIVSNVIRHAPSSSLSFQCMMKKNTLTIFVNQSGGNDNSASLRRWGAGRGTQHIQQRMRDIAGQCEMQQEAGSMRIALILPL